ncbi:hypothetical protein DJ76_03455 [Halorubrum ezzemoulense]|uniref:C2H2-type domain-containing protein n=1 Tax=Halorubrum ezzemoulense TaxID=337243 RepID=A0A256K262_HALEZ|nr:hypothetical protein DJ76_03455 [Halorubrum ezzemoulense]
MTCDRCGTEYNPDRETRGDPRRCPSCGATADVDGARSGEKSRYEDGISCGLCGEPFGGMDEATDHLEDEHSVVKHAILRNVDGIGGEPA